MFAWLTDAKNGCPFRYPHIGGFNKDCRDKDGHLMLLMCLVCVGLPCVGEEGMKLAPKIHPSHRLGYFSWVHHASRCCATVT
jgi:hypothetical protein